MAVKRIAIERCPPPVPVHAGENRWHASKDIVQWLEDLRARKVMCTPGTVLAGIPRLNSMTSTVPSGCST
jgi:hypothetical protein